MTRLHGQAQTESGQNDFCIEALQEEALQRFGTPQISNVDQGSQFTSEAFTDVLKRHGIGISMDGKGRWVDNILGGDPVNRRIRM